MATKFNAPKLELTILRSICERKNEKVAARFLSLDSSFFVYSPVMHSMERIATHLKKTGTIPTFDALVEDPVLPESDRAILSRAFAKAQPITSSADAEIAFTSLRTYRARRKLHEIGDGIQRYLDADEDADDRPDLDKVLEDLGNQVSAATVSHFSSKQIMRIGRGNNSRLAVKELLYGDKPPLVPTGFTAFDSMNGGMPESGLFTVMAPQVVVRP